MDNYMISLMLFLLLIFISRAISEKANKKLSVEKKAELVDLFSSSRIWSFGIIIGLIGLYFLALKSKVLNPEITMIVYMAVIVLFVIIMARFAIKKLKAHNFPANFIQTYILVSTIRLLAIVLFTGMLLNK